LVRNQLYVSDSNNQAIRRIDLGSGTVSTLAGALGIEGNADGTGPAANFRSPVGLATDGVDLLYVADSVNCSIRAITMSTGTVTTVAGGSCGNSDGIGRAAEFSYGFQGLTIDDTATNLYIVDTGNGTIRKMVIATAEVTTLTSGGTGY